MAGTSYVLQSNLGIGQLSVANTNLNGTGTTVLCFTAANADSTTTGGSTIRSIRIKGTASSTLFGMVRLFIYDGTNYYLFREVPVPPTEQRTVLPTFMVEIKTNLKLKAGDKIYATTNLANNFNVFVHGVNNGCCDCNTSQSYPSIKYANNTGLVTISTANGNINGSGTLGTALTALASASNPRNSGTIVRNITVKATGSTTQGMVRLFVNDTVSTKLWGEVMIPARTQSGVIQAFGTSFSTDLILNPDYILYASTQNGETFNVIVDGVNFISCDCGIPG